MYAAADELTALWRGRSLAWMLARRDLATRHAASAGGVMWAYVQPLVLVAAYYLLFDIVFSMRVGDAAGLRTRPAGQFLIVGALPWMAFSDGVSRAMNSLLESGGLLQKNALPPVLFPVRAVLASSLVYGPLLAALAVLYAHAHGYPLVCLAIIPLLALQFVLTTVLGYLLAVLAAALRDITQVVTFMLSVGIFMSPVLFPMHMFPADWQWVLWFNPMTPTVLAYQAVLLYGTWPAWTAWLAPALWIAAGAALLDRVLARSREQLVDWL